MDRSASVYYPMIPEDYPSSGRRRRFSWRFIACVFLVTAGTLYLLLPSSGDGGARLNGHDPWTYSPQQCSDNVNWTTTSDGRGESAYHSRTSFALPVSANELFFVARGPLAHGTFEISESTDTSSKDAIVEIDVFYREANALDRATVCRMHPSKGDWGLGIYSPFWMGLWGNERTLRFNVHVRLPATAPGSPLAINQLRTNLPMFAHRLRDLANSVYFDKIYLTTENAPIEAESLAGNRGRLHSNNGPIRGTFKVADHLTIETSNAPIKVRADLVGGEGHRPTILGLYSSNGRIESDVTLASNRSDARGGSFRVDARTSNSPLYLAVLDAPVDSALTATLRTSNSPARATLHKTFEGSFALASSWFIQPEVQWRPVADPAGRGRRRNVDVRQSGRGYQSGTITWGPPPAGDGAEKMGHVSVETSNSPARIFISD